MKQRFSYLDLKIIANEVSNELEGCYLQNVYSLENSSRHFLLKFDAGANQTGKRFVIIDPGMRFHFTNYQYEPTKQPSHFVQKLRKYLRNRRATNFWVAPASRILAITFSEGRFYLVLEFFAGGNIILLDEHQKILTLYRVVRDVGPNHQTYQIGEQYPLNMGTNESYQTVPPALELKSWITKDKLGKAIYSRISDPSSSLVEYCLQAKGLDPKEKVSGELSDEFVNKVTDAIQMALDWSHSLMSQKDSVKGYILYDKDGNSLEFEPFKEYFEKVHPDLKVEEVSTYNKTVDQYFGAILSDKGINKVEQLHALAESRLNAARNERKKRVEALMAQYEQYERKGNAIQEHADIVEAAISAVKALVDQGMDWVDAENLIKLEKQKKNTVAEAIDSLKLNESKVVLSLDGQKIPVEIGKSAFANARDYFEIRRSALAKIEKTEQQASKALKSAEIKIKRDLEKNLTKHKQAGAAAQLHAIRQPYWFEKFWWFITSTGHIVIASRDEMQRDLVLRRYFQDSDIILSSDAPDASVLIVKNYTSSELPPQAILQAAAFCVATSVKSWEAGSKAPSWYLTRKQVPKINSNGDPISFEDVKRLSSKAQVPAAPLEMGFALLWQHETSAEEDSSEIRGDDVDDHEDGDNDSEDQEFPDTEFNSDEEFPDTNLSSDGEISDSDDDGAEEKSSISQSEDRNVFATSKNATETNFDDQEERISSKENTQFRAEMESAEDISSQPVSGVAELQLNSSDDSQESEDSDSQSVSGTNPSRSGSPAALPKKVRGSKKKLRKYKNQDEEDRLAAIERLGTMKGLQRKAAEEAAKEEARKKEQELLQQRRERRRKTELSFINEQESGSEQQTFPRNLSMKYSEEPRVVAAVPMFAPWSSIQKAQYKVKLVPGNLKKGKAASELLKVILNTGEKAPSQEELKLVAAIKQPDVQQAIAVSRVQLSIAMQKGKNAKGANRAPSKKGKGKS